MKDGKNIIKFSTTDVTKSSIDNNVRDGPEKDIELAELREKSKCYDQLTEKIKDLECEKDKLLVELKRNSACVDILKKKLKDSETEREKLSEELEWKSMCYDQLKKHFLRFNKQKKES